MLRPFLLPHSPPCSHRTSQNLKQLFNLKQVQTGTCPRATSMGLDCPLALGQEEGTGTALLPNPTRLGCPKMGDNAPEGKTLGLINSH